MRKHHQRHIGIFFYFEKHLSLLHAQINGKCSDSSHSRLKRRYSRKWIANYDAVFVFKFFPAVADSLDELSESRDSEVFGRAMLYFKVITRAYFKGHQEIILTA